MSQGDTKTTENDYAPIQLLESMAQKEKTEDYIKMKVECSGEETETIVTTVHPMKYYQRMQSKLSNYCR